MRRIVQALNNYFFGDDDIVLSDGLWFYGGSITFIVFILAAIILRILM